MIPTKNTDNSIGKEVAVIVITTAVSIALQHAAEIVVNKFFPSDNNKKQPEQQEEHLITEKDIEEMIDKSVKKHLDLRFSEYVAEQKQLNKRVRTRQS